MQIQMGTGDVIHRTRIIVVDGDTDEFPCGLITYDGGRYLKVIYQDGQWIEHPTEWRIFDSIREAQKHSWKIQPRDVEVAEALADMLT